MRKGSKKRRAEAAKRLRSRLERDNRHERRAVKQRQKVHRFAARCAEVGGLDGMDLSREELADALEYTARHLHKKGLATEQQLEGLRYANEVARAMGILESADAP